MCPSYYLSLWKKMEIWSIYDNQSLIVEKSAHSEQITACISWQFFNLLCLVCVEPNMMRACTLLEDCRRPSAINCVLYPEIFRHFLQIFSVDENGIVCFGCFTLRFIQSCLYRTLRHIYLLVHVDLPVSTCVFNDDFSLRLNSVPVA